MNNGFSPVGVNTGFKSVHIKPNKAIDAAYARELKAIRNSRVDNDVFEKVNPASSMQKVIHKIQITIDSMKGVGV